MDISNDFAKISVLGKDGPVNSDWSGKVQEHIECDLS